METITNLKQLKKSIYDGNSWYSVEIDDWYCKEFKVLILKKNPEYPFGSVYFTDYKMFLDKSANEYANTIFKKCGFDINIVLKGETNEK